MEEMKNFIRLFLPFLLVISLISCATSGAVKENQPKGKKLLFEDWKYRGFGHELPVWLESAYKDNLTELKALVSELSDKEVLILRGEGSNSDQSEHALQLEIAELSSDYKLYDSSWGMLEEGIYISLAILYKE